MKRSRITYKDYLQVFLLFNANFAGCVPVTFALSNRQNTNLFELCYCEQKSNEAENELRSAR